MKKKMLTLVSLLLVCVLFFSACGTGKETVSTESTNSESTETSTAEAVASTKDSVTIRLMRDPDTCFTGDYQNQNTQDPVNRCVVESLVHENFEDKSIIEPMLAESWEADEDNMGVTFYLRQDVTFHDGTPFTAADVEYTFSQLIPGSTQGNQYSWIDFENTKAIDEYTVYVPMKEYNITWADDLSFIGIYCKSYCEANADDPQLFLSKCIGTGAYKIDSWTTNDSVVLSRYDGYWGEPAKIEHVTFRVISENSVAMMELQTGGIDVIFDAEYADARDIEADANSEFRVYKQSQQLQAFLGFNMNSATVADYRVRKAICMGVDRDALVAGTFDGEGHVPYCVCSDVAEGLHTWTEDDWPIPYDPEGAKALLAEAGATNLELNIIADSNDPLRKGVAEQFANMMEQIDVKVNIILLDGSVVADTLVNETQPYDMFIRRNGGTPAPGAVAAAIINNIGDKCHHNESELTADMYELLVKVTQTADDTERLKLWDEYQVRFLDEWLSYYPYHQGYVYVLTVNNLENVKWNTFAYNVWEWSYS